MIEGRHRALSRRDHGELHTAGRIARDIEAQDAGGFMPAGLEADTLEHAGAAQAAAMRSLS
ncbi:hypothetical protein [Roseicella aerolata]|uniref:Uncharacterized protein n=1 Tax=Roseicella aerolata TaxID=2883479 RepID=A0A9X1IHW7_9PROT|nr:hypothetical protein [Roseicella aerolata]MCB4824922.1 hypothetical protein [Roseicella aerolata]